MKGLLLVFFDPAPTLEEELNDWYNSEHLPERAVLPGVETAQRYVSLGDGPRYAAIYDRPPLEVLQGGVPLAVGGVNCRLGTDGTGGGAQRVGLAAQQTPPAGPVTGPWARLLLLKSGGGGGATAIAAGLEASFGSAPGHAKSRVFAGVEPQADFMLAIAEFYVNDVPPLNIEAFGPWGARIELAATYRPHRA